MQTIRTASGLSMGAAGWQGVRRLPQPLAVYFAWHSGGEACCSAAGSNNDKNGPKLPNPPQSTFITFSSLLLRLKALAGTAQTCREFLALQSMFWSRRRKRRRRRISSKQQKMKPMQSGFAVRRDLWDAGWLWIGPNEGCSRRAAWKDLFSRWTRPVGAPSLSSEMECRRVESPSVSSLPKRVPKHRYVLRVCQHLLCRVLNLSLCSPPSHTLDMRGWLGVESQQRSVLAGAVVPRTSRQSIEAGRNRVSTGHARLHSP